MEETAALLASWQLALHNRAASTRVSYLAELHRYAAWLPEGTGLLEARRGDVEGYLAHLRDAGRSPATIRSRWIALRAFYGWAVQEEEITESPMLHVKVDRPEPPPPQMPDDASMARLFAACGGKAMNDRRDLAAIRLGAATGMRVGELAALEVGDVDLLARVVVIRHGKGDRSRVVRIDPETAAVIDRYLRARSRTRFANVPELWISRFGPLGRKGLMEMLSRRCVQAGIQHLHWHLLRHRYAHTYLARGGQEGDLARLGGWTDPAVMRRYGSALAVERALAAYDDVGGVL